LITELCSWPQVYNNPDHNTNTWPWSQPPPQHILTLTIIHSDPQHTLTTSPSFPILTTTTPWSSTHPDHLPIILYSDHNSPRPSTHPDPDHRHTLTLNTPWPRLSLLLNHITTGAKRLIIYTRINTLYSYI